ncbi:hypothetical protein ACRQ5Q_22220 [Bradyrhizobium sp. PMVTL-01]|uniref:hypothetical protein n=1 Tax=Bradyrhizobium sp. PMVTL-01 TaxID=3434999 RepID=UPI003F718C40
MRFPGRLLLQGLFLVLAVEAMSWLFAVASMHRGNPYRLYSPTRLEAAIEANLPKEREAPSLGWGNESARAHPPLTTPICGSAWGNSFTFGDDVEDKDAWPYLLSVHLGCQIENFGSDGYGLDQTALLFERKAPGGSLIIVGLNWPMLQLDALTSWAFIDPENGVPAARVTKPIFDRGATTLIPRPASTVEAITAHYAKDAAAGDWTQLTFPYSVAVGKAIWRHFSVPAFTDSGPMSNTAISSDLHARGGALIARMSEFAHAHSDRLVIVLLPPVDARVPASQMYQRLLAVLPAGTCVIDPTDEFNALASREPIKTASGHYSAAANGLIAHTVSQGLSRCGFAS